VFGSAFERGLIEFCRSSQELQTAGTVRATGASTIGTPNRTEATGSRSRPNLSSQCSIANQGGQL
jgi:hypothetical protein